MSIQHCPRGVGAAPTASRLPVLEDHDEFAKSIIAFVSKMEADYAIIRGSNSAFATEVMSERQFEEEKTRISAMVARIKAESTSLRADKIELEGRVQRLDKLARASVPRSEFEALAAEHADLTIRVQEAAQQQSFYADLSLRAARLQNDYQFIRSERDAADAKARAAQSDAAEARATLAVLQAHHAVTSASLARAEGELPALRESRAGAAKLEASVAALTEQLRATEAELSATKAKLGSHEALVGLLTTELGQHVAAKSERDNLSTQLQAARADIAAAVEARAAAERAAQASAAEAEAARDKANAAHAGMHGQASAFAREQAVATVELSAAHAREADAVKRARAAEEKVAESERLRKEAEEKAAAAVAEAAELSAAGKELQTKVQALEASVARAEAECARKAGSSAASATALERRAATMEAHALAERSAAAQARAAVAAAIKERDVAVAACRQLQARHKALVADKAAAENEAITLRIGSATVDALKAAEANAVLRGNTLAEELAAARADCVRLEAVAAEARASETRARDAARAAEAEAGRALALVAHGKRDIAELLAAYDASKMLLSKYQSGASCGQAQSKSQGKELPKWRT